MFKKRWAGDWRRFGRRICIPGWLSVAVSCTASSFLCSSALVRSVCPRCNCQATLCTSNLSIYPTSYRSVYRQLLTSFVSLSNFLFSPSVIIMLIISLPISWKKKLCQFLPKNRTILTWWAQKMDFFLRKNKLPSVSSFDFDVFMYS